MKPLFTILFILISLVSYSQEGQVLGNALKHEFVTSDWGKKWGLLYTPNDTLKHPVIAFFHGVGEAGTGSSDAALSKLQTHGVFNFIKSGNKMEFINPVNGKLTKFICIALQDQYWSPDPGQVYFAILNDPLLKNKVDTNGIFFTGLSAGGQQVLNSLCTDVCLSNGITAIVPMSSAGYNNDLVYLATGKYVWAFHGLEDKTCPYQITEAFVASVGSTAKWTKLPTTHGNWNTYYNPTYRENGMNIYEWMLSKMPVIILGINRIDIVHTKNKVSWSVDDESDVLYYEVQETTDGIHFKTIKKVLRNGKKNYNIVIN